MKVIRIMRFRKIGPYLVAVCALLGVGAIGLLNREVLAKEANNWQVLPQPERLSELYFTNPHQLSEELTRKQSVTFTVHNLEHQSIRYVYIILATSTEANTAEHTLDKGSFTLGQDESRVTSQNITLPSLPGRTAVRVVLDYERSATGSDTPKSHRHSIHYWVNSDDLSENAARP